MKRNVIIQKLVKEGFSEKTLSSFTDKQILSLSERILKEQVSTAPKKPEITIPKTMSNPMDTLKKVQNAVGQNAKVSVSEENGDVKENLKGNQKKIDVNKNNKIDKEDFKLLKKKKEVKEDGWDSKLVSKKSKEIGKSVKSRSVGRNFDNLSMDDSQIGKSDDDFYVKLKKSKYNPEKGELELPNDLDESKKRNIGKNKKMALTLKKLKEHSDTKEWVSKLVETNYHSMTTKNEIMELITSKLNESEVQENNPQTSPKPSPTTVPNPTTKPQKPKRENPFEPKHNPKPKAEVKLPEFMKFKNIGIRLKNSK